MEKVISQYWTIRNLSEEIANSLANYLKLDSQLYPVGFFNMVFNKSTLTLELLSYYEKEWRGLTSIEGVTVEDAKEQNALRVVLIQRMTFISIMSSFEYTAKKIIEKGDSKLVISSTGRLYLREVMKKSLHQGIISHAQYELWLGAIELRNSLVHNNGIPEDTITYAYPEFELKLIKDEMPVGKLNLFGDLNQWVITASEEWFKTIYS